jgi:phospholipid/cholesterol/gamma-HCH transport system substrate-binding protein
LKFSTEFKIGLLVLLAIAMAYWGINYMKGIDIFKQDRIFYATYDRVDGLSNSNLVTLNGYPIGLVREIQLVPELGNKVMVTFAITQTDLRIPKDSEARIFSSDLLGSKQVELIIGSSPEIAMEGDTLTASMEKDLASAVNAQLAPLKLKAEELLGQIEQAVVTVQSVFDESARENLSQSFQHIQESFYAVSLTAKRLDTLIAKEKPAMESMIDNLSSFSASLNNNKDNISRLTENLADISDSLRTAELKEAVANAAAALEQFTILMDQASQGKGTVGKLLHDDSLYNSLNTATTNLASLLEDMETNPDRYVQVSVFGKKAKKVKLSNKDVERISKAVLEQQKP